MKPGTFLHNNGHNRISNIKNEEIMTFYINNW